MCFLSVYFEVHWFWVLVFCSRVCCVFNVISIMCSPTLIKTSKKIDKKIGFIWTHQKMLGFAFVSWVLESCVFGVFDFILMCCGVYCAWCVLEVCFMWCILKVCWKFVVSANVFSNIHTSHFLCIWCVFLCFMSPISSLLVLLKDGPKEELLKPYNHQTWQNFHSNLSLGLAFELKIIFV
jgi:hypothetical protein